MMEFTDKLGRVIALQINDEQNIEARHGAKVIGTFEFRQDEDYPGELWELWHMNVAGCYQKSGIGSAMMRLAVQDYGYFMLPKPINFVGAPNYLTEEGAALVNHCFRTGILPKDFRGQYDQE
jgi:hypothetical protein